ncbi:CBS domain-containing protein [Candidatus Woesearchaeota archaeon]|nr:CBS domain-containing protein [Candidatus Woesearchaeota archaeon]
MSEITSGYKVCDVMTRKPISVSPKKTIMDCALLMQEKGVGSLVVKTGDRLEGYITEQTIVSQIVAKGKDSSKVKADEIMAKRVATIHPNADLLDALKKMKELEVRQLPVIDAENGEKLVGLLTFKDIVAVQPQIFEIIEEKLPLQEEERKRNSVLEGTCDACGDYFKKLYEKQGNFLCEKCSAGK